MNFLTSLLDAIGQGAQMTGDQASQLFGTQPPTMPQAPARMPAPMAQAGPSLTPAERQGVGLAPPSLASYAGGALRGASQANNPIGALLGAVGGAIGAGEGVDQRNQTFRLLVKRGVPEVDAALAVSNPTMMQALLTNMVRKPDVKEVNGRLVSIGADNSVKEIYSSPDSGAAKISYGVNPMFTQDGKPYVVGNNGAVKYLDLGPNAKPLAPGELAYAKAKGAATGKTLAQAQHDLPKAMENASLTMSTLDALENDPHLDSMVGMVGGRTPDITEAANRTRARMDQIQGQAFLTAFQSLRGGGQITEIEGKKATDAITRLGNRLQSPQDYRRAIADLKRIAANGLIRAKVDAGVLPQEALGQVMNFDAPMPSQQPAPQGAPAPATGGFKYIGRADDPNMGVMP